LAPDTDVLVFQRHHTIEDLLAFFVIRGVIQVIASGAELADPFGEDAIGIIN
jgi:hypothetical protein